MVSIFNQAEMASIGDDILYHYTKSESFFKILENMTLRPGDFKNLNDLNEANIYNLYTNSWKKIFDIEEYIKNKCNLICFTKNYEVKERIDIQKGTNRPSMWAHYAENNNGVCIILDKQKFVEINKTILDNVFYKFEDVEYEFKNGVDERDLQTNNSPEDFIKQNYRKIFYLKHKDWESENEHRLFYIGVKKEFSILDCVKYIELGNKFVSNEEMMERLVKTISNPINACYKCFVPHSFSVSSYNGTGYIGLDASSFVEKHLRMLKNNISDYCDWYYSNFK